MKITAIILNWNRPEDTIKAAESVLAQDYPDVSVLIWDNNSTRDVQDMLTVRIGNHPKVRLLFAELNYGVAGGRNRAFRISDGDIAFFLDSDAVIETPNALSMVAQRMTEDAGLGAISFEIKRSDGFLMWPFSRPSSQWRNKEFETMRVDGCAFAVRREAFERAGGFAEHFSPYGAEDAHFAYKLLDAGYRILYYPKAVAIHAFSPAGRTGIQFIMHVRNMLLIPLELFPMPHAVLSFGKMATSLGCDAWRQHQVRDFLHGLRESVSAFDLMERIPISRRHWRRLRDMIRVDKALSFKS